MQRHKHEKLEEVTEADTKVGTAGDVAARGAETDDLEKYLVHLAHLDMPLPMKIELIRVVGDLMQSFVDRAFGDDPTQLALQAGGNWNKPDTDRSAGVLEWPPANPDNPNILTSEFRQEAEPREEKEIDT